MNTFLTPNDKFIPKIIDSKNKTPKTDIEKNQEDLEGKFIELFGLDSLKLDKLYDEDVIEYFDFANTYSSNLYHDYKEKYNNIKLSDTESKNKEHEYDLNTSFYSCCILELSKYNLLLEKDLLYKNLSDKFYVNHSKLIHNVTKDHSKCDIIIINPLKFNENSFLDLITNIIASINTDLKVLENNTFEFSRGLYDNFTKQNFFPSLVWDEKYVLFTDFVNKNLALEVVHYFQNHNITIWKYSNFPINSLYSFTNDIHFDEFFSYHKRNILDAIIMKDNEVLFKNIGENNFIKFIELIYEYKLQKSSENIKNISKNSTFQNYFSEIQQLLIDMKNYSKNN